MCKTLKRNSEDFFQGSISSTFYVQLLRAQIQKDTECLTEF